MGEIRFIADLHLDHERVLSFDGRSFESLEEMREYIHDAWNAEVSSRDETWILGDLCRKPTEDVRKFVLSLNGQKHLVLGNHDKASGLSNWFGVFESIEQLKVLSLGEMPVMVCHYPIESWPYKLNGSCCIHGHVHGSEWDYAKMPNRYNAWCVALDYAPRTLSWFKARYGYDQDYYKEKFALWLRDREV